VKIIEWLKLPETRHIEELDDPAVSMLHGRIVQRKRFLRRLYVDFYKEFRGAVADCENKTLVELGSGGGFIKEIIPNVITSDIVGMPNVDKVFSASKMPFASESIDAFFMLDVLHHISRPRDFFREAARCLTNSGKIVMIEPANSYWSRFIFRNFHHEPFDTDAGWDLEEGGPLSHANIALPWIVFCRDRSIFEREFGVLRVASIHYHTPFRYLLSGGLTWRQPVPSFSYPIVRLVEKILKPANKWIGMFQTIKIEKTGGEDK